MLRQPKILQFQRMVQWCQLLLVLVCLGLTVVVLARWVRMQQLPAVSPGSTGKPADAMAVYWQTPKRSGEAGMLKPVTGKELVQGDPSKKMIALTFDDGPYPEFTPQLLAVLKWYHARATFFLVGSRVEAYPELTRAIAADGHTLANHTYHHDSLVLLGPTDFHLEIRSCSEAIERVTGQAPHFFRPPGGRYDLQVAQAAEKSGCRTVLWTANTSDYLRPEARIIEARVVAGAKNGAIILQHDRVQQTLDALPNIIEDLQARGYRFVSLDEMVGTGTQ